MFMLLTTNLTKTVYSLIELAYFVAPFKLRQHLFGLFCQLSVHIRLRRFFGASPAAFPNSPYQYIHLPVQISGRNVDLLDLHALFDGCSHESSMSLALPLARMCHRSRHQDAERTSLQRRGPSFVRVPRRHCICSSRRCGSRLLFRCGVCQRSSTCRCL